MPDLTLFTAALASLRTATDVAKSLRDNDLAVEKAELKLKLADLIGSLADARIQLVELQELIGAKDARIAELEEAFTAKDSLVRNYDAYYLTTEDGKPTGHPFCLRCWEVDHRQRRLVQSPLHFGTMICSDCKSSYADGSAGRMK